MPEWLCPTCKADLCGNVEDGEFCRHCGYTRIGNKALRRQRGEEEPEKKIENEDKKDG